MKVTAPRHRISPGAAALLVLALLPYLVVALIALETHRMDDPSFSSGEDRYGLAWQRLFATFFTIVLLLLLSAVPFLQRRQNAATSPATGTIILYTGAVAIALWISLATGFGFPGGWSFLIPVALPVCAAALALWGIRNPAASPSRAVPILRNATLALCAASLPLWVLDISQAPGRWAAQSAAREVESKLAAARGEESGKLRRLQHEAELAALTEDSPLAAYVRLLDFEVVIEQDSTFEDRVLAKARTAKSRQADFLPLLRDRHLGRLSWMWRLDLIATPELCRAYHAAFAKYIQLDPTYPMNAIERVNLQIPNLHWFAQAGCAPPDTVHALEGVLNTAATKTLPTDSQVVAVHGVLAELRAANGNP